MKLLVFGGSFDPPHIGHVAILQAAIQLVQPDKALVIPTGQPPHKQAGVTPAALRLAMCECFRAISPLVEVSDMEIRRGGRSYTYETLRELQRGRPGARLYLCMGSDMLHTFTQWKNWQEILQSATLVVQNREQADMAESGRAAEALQGLGGRVLFTEGFICPAASSALRAAIAAGKDVTDELPPPVADIIAQNGLYRQGQGGEQAAESFRDPRACGEGAAVTICEAKQLAKQKLGKKRYKHVENVAAAARRLALQHGYDPERAALAAWLHDIVKEYSPGDLLQMLGQDAIMAGLTAQRPEAIWHGTCAAIYAKHKLGLNDKELFDALDCHTTGRPGMTKLDKILYLADKISAERTFDGVEQIRAAARQSLDEAVILTLRRSVEYTKATGRPLDEESVRALEWLENGGDGLEGKG